MIRRNRLTKITVWALSSGTLSALLVVPVSAQSFSLLRNGNFETGDFSDWTVANTRDTGTTNPTGRVGGFFIDTPGTTTPAVGVNNTTFNTAPNASGGNFYAVTSSDYPGQSALLQNFIVPNLANLQVTLTFQMFVSDQSGFGGVVDPSGLDYTTGGTFDANQHARVDILSSASKEFTTLPNDVVRNVYLGADGTSLPAPYVTYTINLTPNLVRGQSYRLRFAEVDNLSALNLGFDNVAITATVVPEPSSIGFVGFALGASPWVIAKRKK